MPNSANRCRIRRHRNKVLGDRLFITKLCHTPVSRRVSVGHGLLCCKGLGTNHEKSFSGNKIAGGLQEISGIDIRNKMGK